MMDRKNTWMCINCGEILGSVYGSEFYPDVPGKNIHTSGPNLTVTCPKCGHVKVWYSADPLVRAVYQLITVIADVTAKAAVESAGRAINTK